MINIITNDVTFDNVKTRIVKNLMEKNIRNYYRWLTNDRNERVYRTWRNDFEDTWKIFGEISEKSREEVYNRYMIERVRSEIIVPENKRHRFMKFDLNENGDLVGRIGRSTATLS